MPIRNEEAISRAFGKEVLKMPIDPVGGYSAFDQSQLREAMPARSRNPRRRHTATKGASHAMPSMRSTALTQQKTNPDI